MKNKNVSVSYGNLSFQKMDDIERMKGVNMK